MTACVLLAIVAAPSSQSSHTVGQTRPPCMYVRTRRVRASFCALNNSIWSKLMAPWRSISVARRAPWYRSFDEPMNDTPYIHGQVPTDVPKLPRTHLAICVHSPDLASLVAYPTSPQLSGHRSVQSSGKLILDRAQFTMS